jgi:phage baseplate assembly protein W
LSINSDKPHIGKGLSFPLRINAKGEIGLSGGDKDIQQSIFIILSTRPGERVMRPEFGCRAHELIFESQDAATFALLKKYVTEALEFWEPRINVRSVNPTIEEGADSSIYVEIEYEIKATHDVRNIVYPFFLTDQENW